jgi:hypothetical protein
VIDVFAKERAQGSRPRLGAAGHASGVGVDGRTEVAVALQLEEFLHACATDCHESLEQIGLEVTQRPSLPGRTPNQVLKLVELADKEIGVVEIDGMEDTHHGPPAMRVLWKTVAL